MTIAPTLEREYKNRKGETWNLKAYFPNEDEDTMVLNSVVSIKRKMYVSYPECYIEITSPDGGINAHLLSNDNEFKKFLHSCSGIWGANFWKDLENNQLI